MTDHSTAPAPQSRGQALTPMLFKRLMPLLILAYVISFIDRTNIALAKEHIAADIGISAAAYGLGAGLFFLSYACLEIPSNLMMHRLGARLWITRIMVTWGLLSAGMAFVQGETSFYVMRLLLGAAEAGLFPGVMLYLTYWFGSRDRARATGYFLIGVCIANIVSGPLAGALLELDGIGGWHGWQWLFVIEGLPAVGLAWVVWKHLPDGPETAPWLSDEDRQALRQHLGQDEGHVDRQSFKQCLRDPQIWLAIAVYFCHQISIYTVIFFLPSIIGTYGQLSPLQIGLLTAIPWIAAALGAVSLPTLATSPLRCRILLGVGLVIMAVGLAMAAWTGPVLGMVGFSLTASMFFVVQSVVFVYPTSRLSGPALAGGIALVNTCGLMGGFLGPTAMGLIEQATGTTQGGLIAIALLLLVAATISQKLRQGQER